MILLFSILFLTMIAGLLFKIEDIREDKGKPPLISLIRDMPSKAWYILISAFIVVTLLLYFSVTAHSQAPVLDAPAYQFTQSRMPTAARPSSSVIYVEHFRDSVAYHVDFEGVTPIQFGMEGKPNDVISWLILNWILRVNENPHTLHIKFWPQLTNMYVTYDYGLFLLTETAIVDQKVGIPNVITTSFGSVDLWEFVEFVRYRLWEKYSQWQQ
jgi:hypothetical protein